jgi:hypothetical protein
LYRQVCRNLILASLTLTHWPLPQSKGMISCKFLPTKYEIHLSINKGCMGKCKKYILALVTLTLYSTLRKNPTILCSYQISEISVNIIRLKCKIYFWHWWPWIWPLTEPKERGLLLAVYILHEWHQLKK